MKKPTRNGQEVYISAFLADHAEGRNLIGMDPPVLYAAPGALTVTLLRLLYFTIYLRRGRRGAHRLRIVLRDTNWVERSALELPPPEIAEEEVSAIGQPVEFTFPPARHYVCVNFDGVDEAVIPIQVEREPPDR